MRIALVHSFYSSVEPSGENAVVIEQSRLLKEAGHQVLDVFLYTDDLAKQKSYPLRAALTVAAGVGADPSPELERFRPDVISLHNLFPNWGRRWLRPWGHRTVQTVHNFRTFCSKATFERSGLDCVECPTLGAHRAVVHACYRDSRLASIPVAISTCRGRWPDRNPASPARMVWLTEAAAARHRAFMPGIRGAVIPNFVTPAPDEHAIASSSRAGYVFAGRLSPEKGAGWLTEHWPSDRALDVIGSGPLRTLVEGWAQNRANVNYVGPLPRSTLRQRLASYRALVIPSLWSEGLPTIVLEALSVGTPVIVSSMVSAAPDLVSGGGALAYEPSEGARGLSAALQALEGADQLSKAAAALYEKRYSPLRWLDHTTALYREVMAEARASS